MNVIRIAESTWGTMEPKRGCFDFHHIDRVLDKAQKSKILEKRLEVEIEDSVYEEIRKIIEK